MLAVVILRKLSSILLLFSMGKIKIGLKILIMANIRYQICNKKMKKSVTKMKIRDRVKLNYFFLVHVSKKRGGGSGPGNVPYFFNFFLGKTKSDQDTLKHKINT